MRILSAQECQTAPHVAHDRPIARGQSGCGKAGERGSERGSGSGNGNGTGSERGSGSGCGSERDPASVRLQNGGEEIEGNPSESVRSPSGRPQNETGHGEGGKCSS